MIEYGQLLVHIWNIDLSSLLLLKTGNYCDINIQNAFVPKTKQIYTEYVFSLKYLFPFFLFAR